MKPTPAAGCRNVYGRISGDLGQGNGRTAGLFLASDPIFAKPWRKSRQCAADVEARSRASPDRPYIRCGRRRQGAAEFLIPAFDIAEDYMALRVGLSRVMGALHQYLTAGCARAGRVLRTAIIKVRSISSSSTRVANHDALRPRAISAFFNVHDAELAFQPGWPHSARAGEVFVEGAVCASWPQGPVARHQVRNLSQYSPRAAGKDSHRCSPVVCRRHG